MTSMHIKNTDTTNTDMKYLQFYCGPYTLLLPLGSIMEIGQYTDALLTRENSVGGNFASWRGTEIPYIDLRNSLEIERDNTMLPLHVLMLQQQDHDTATVMIAIDDIEKTIHIQDHQWHWINGINCEIDRFFDRIFPEPSSGKLMFRLANFKQWITNLPNKNNGEADAH